MSIKTICDICKKPVKYDNLIKVGRGKIIATNAGKIKPTGPKFTKCKGDKKEFPRRCLQRGISAAS